MSVGRNPSLRFNSQCNWALIPGDEFSFNIKPTEEYSFDIIKKSGQWQLKGAYDFHVAMREDGVACLRGYFISTVSFIVTPTPSFTKHCMDTK